MPRKIFVNLPVKNLGKTKAFFSKLGFKFNRKFTDKNAACMVISKDIYSMLIVEKFFKQFTKKKIANAKKTTEAIIALTVDSRKKVDELVNKALKLGAKEPRKPQDNGFMYLRCVEDFDGHMWEIFWMDLMKIKKG